MLRVVSHPLGPLPALAPRRTEWHGELDAAFVSAPGTELLVQRLHQPGALAVTTGQQPGLFAGPAYTVHKALCAVALARVLERRWQRPVVPIFWVAGDDHDFAEASTATWPDAAGTLVDWGLPARSTAAPQRPMSEEQLPVEVTQGLLLLEQSLPTGLPRDRTLDWLRRHYTPGSTVHAAYAGALAELLAPYGVLCFDPTHPAAKHAQVPLLRSALQRAGELDRALAALAATGTGITAGEGATLVFVTTSSGRDRLLIDGDGYRARRSRERFSGSQLDALLDHAPERFSANVLLRPVVEAALLPTVAYIAGPGELRYLTAQASTLYPLLGVLRQTPVPRWSGTIIMRWAERLLGRLHLTANAVLDDDGTLAHALLDRDFPGDARQAIDALHRQIERSGSVITAAGTRLDPVLERAVRGRIERIDQVTDDLERILLRHLRQRERIAYAQFRRLDQGLLPHGKPQERVFASAAFLGRYGDAWLGSVFESIAAWAEHVPKEAQ